MSNFIAMPIDDLHREQMDKIIGPITHKWFLGLERRDEII
jgi:hypothetical protein